jgi:tetratricopeptide (TPR) repeat protein
VNDFAAAICGTWRFSGGYFRRRSFGADDTNLASYAFSSRKKSFTALPGEVAEALRPFAQPDSPGRLRDSARPAPRYRKPIFALAIAACLLFLGAGYWLTQVVFRVETPGGTLIITTDDPEVQISVKSNGREVELFFPREKKEIPLKVGEYSIELVKGKDGLKLSTNNFRIESGKGKTVTVEFVPVVVERVEELLKKAQAALADNRHDEVRALAARILKQDGKNAKAYYLRGETLNRQNNLVEGIRELDQALGLDPKHARALASRAFAFLNTNQRERAIADCMALLKLQPPKDLAALAHANRGGARAWRGNFDAALADFEAALALDNRWALWVYWRGMVHRRLGNTKQGEADRVRAIEMDPSLAKQPFDRFDSVVAQPLPWQEWLDGREVLTVAQDGKAMFTTIGAALEKAKAGQVIRVLDKGPYRESISRETPDNVALVGEGATRIEIPKWTLWGPDPANKAKNIYQGFVLYSSVGLRLSGLEFICPEVPADASYAVAVELAMAGEVVVESCRITHTPSYDRDAAPQEWKGEEFYALRIGKDDPGSRQFVRENHLEGTMDFVRGEAADIVMERNRVLAPRLSQGVRVVPSHAGKTVIRHNVIHAFNGIALAPQDANVETRATYLIANNVLDVVNCPLWAWGDEKLAVPKTVRIHNNLVHSRDKNGFEVSAQHFPNIKDAWQVGHNGFRDKPPEPADRPSGMYHWPLGKLDQIRDALFLSDTRGELTKYLRIAADSPLATGGAGGDLPRYIGAFPPGPAPKDGDWFTRLLAHAAPPLPAKAAFAWPVDALRESRIPAPDLSKAKVLFRDDFSDPKSGWPNGRFDENTTRGYENGRYVIRATAGPYWSVWNCPAASASSFACEVVGRWTGPRADGWGVAFGKQVNKDLWHGLLTRLTGEGKLSIGPNPSEADKTQNPKVGPLGHAAIRPMRSSIRCW